MYLYVSGSKSEPVNYYGDRSLEDMISFVKYHTDAEYRKQADAELAEKQRTQEDTFAD